MVDGVESCGEIEKTQTRYFLRANSINQIIMYIWESSFSGMMFAVSRLIWIEKVIRGKVTGQKRFNKLSERLTMLVIVGTSMGAHYFRRQVGIGSKSDCLLRQPRRIFEISFRSR